MNSYTVKTNRYKDPYTYVVVEQTIEAPVPGGKKTVKIQGEGFTKRSACDAPSKSVGYEVALARAIEDLRKNRIKRLNAPVQ
jgi:hypothetical protein